MTTAARAFNGSRVLVTGGAGFIGSHLVELLAASGATVTVFDNLRSGSLRNLVRTQVDSGAVRFWQGDLRDAPELTRAVDGNEVVFHLGANASVPESVEDPDYDFETNAVGSQQLYSACIAARVKRVVFTSTAAVYGRPVYAPIDEDHPLDPVSPYGASKLAAERLGFTYQRVYGLPFVGIRLFNVYGERQRKYVMYDLLRKIQIDPKGTLELLGDGQQTRAFCYVRDACEGLLLAAAHPRAIGEVFNLGGAEPMTVAQLANVMLRLLGFRDQRSLTFSGHSWKGDIEQMIPDTQKIHAWLGFKPLTSLEDGLRRLLAEVRESDTAMALVGGA
ncbi:MAG TPA: SDR family NAD(P)-dependent oxidoreductase [Chloroflexota bacterium]|nr:SDR family NAD(P)-dependent oxidoreductase [Chloroflexota bacterium]